MSQSKKSEIRFKNLPLLLSDMEKKEWVIDSFPFVYKKCNYIVILTLYNDREKRPNNYAKAKVEIIKSENIYASIKGFMDFYNVKFNSVTEFCDFFNVHIGNANRDIFADFSEIFSSFIPCKKIIIKHDIERVLIGSHAEANNSNAIYCYDVRRNGAKENGLPNKRSVENSNKTQTLRPELYKKYYSDKNLSFFFSKNPDDERTDSEIIKTFANRERY